MGPYQVLKQINSSFYAVELFKDVVIFKNFNVKNLFKYHGPKVRE